MLILLIALATFSAMHADDCKLELMNPKCGRAVAAPFTAHERQGYDELESGQVRARRLLDAHRVERQLSVTWERQE